MTGLLIVLFVLWAFVAYIAAAIRVMNAAMDYDLERQHRQSHARRLLTALVDFPFAPLTMMVRVSAFARRLREEARNET